MLGFFQYCCKTQIIGGEPGILQAFGPELEAFHGRRACVVTDKVIQGLGLVEQAKVSLTAAEIEMVVVFADVPADSDVDVVERTAALFQAAGCEILIAIGGGSVIDTAKAVNILLTHGGNLRDYQGAQTLTNPLLPLVAIPTTVGTGSEVTMVAVVADHADARKLTFVDRSLSPTLAVLDPSVTYSLPKQLVAATALDAFTHAIEAYIDIEHAPFSDAFAVLAGRMIREVLFEALRDEGNEEARATLQIASTMAGIAFNHSMVGVVHAMAHALGGVAGVPHGVANGLMLIEGLTCNAEAAGARIVEFGRLTGFVSFTKEESLAKQVSLTLAAIAKLRTAVFAKAKLPNTLGGYGVNVQQLPLLVERAMEDGSMIYNPKLVEEAELAEMFLRMMGV